MLFRLADGANRLLPGREDLHDDEWSCLRASE
jgi:hypothetical protein